MSGVACKWCGDNPGTGRQECNRCRRIWLAGYEAARKRAAAIAQDETCDPNWSVEIAERIIAMQPEKP